MRKITLPAMVASLLVAPLWLFGAEQGDKRLLPPKDLNGYFQFIPPKDKASWDKRAEYVRRQILVSQGIFPLPTKTPLNAVLHGKVDKGEYTIEKVYFESVPGFFVTGNLYRPKNPKGKVPGVMFAHGHWRDARLSEASPDSVIKEISIGAERFEQGGQSIFQSMCVQLARMGCVAWQWDMLSDSDSVQLSREIVHTFGKQRPDMNTTKNWGLYSPQAEAHLQSIMGLQTLNAVRSLDFLLSLPEVDPERTAITGASGGGTQTMLLAAVDPRMKLAFPAVMVSTAMQGGCTCENSSLLRVNTGNIEFAGLFAPKPQGMTTANDWTKEMATKGFPELKALYSMLGKANNVMLHRGEHFQHNYNAVARSAFYTWVNQHFKLGLKSPVVEKDYQPLGKSQLTVWDADHPAPKGGVEFEKQLLNWLTEDAEKQLLTSATTKKGWENVLRPGVEVILGRTYANGGEVEWVLKDKKEHRTSVVMSGLLQNKTHGEEVAVTWVYPKEWKGKAVIWLDDAGQRGLFNADGTVKPEVSKLVNAGITVVGADLFLQSKGEKNRLVGNPREFAGYTYGYNHALFAQRTHDVLTLTRFLRNTKVENHPSPSSVGLAAFGSTGPIALAARALAGEAIDKAAVNTGAFRFGNLLDYRDPMFLPGGAKYLDLPGLIGLNAPHALWVAGEKESLPLAKQAYELNKNPGGLSFTNGVEGKTAEAAAAWLAK